MKSVFRLFALFLGSLMFAAATAAAAPFDRAAFDKLVATGSPVVLQFHADWCPTCKAQAPVIAQVLAEPRFSQLKFLVADFDSEKDLKKALRVSTQSTFVVFKGGKEVARSTGQTARSDVEATFAKAL